jgi:2-methylisocitrate lyase-like PEP mutase family enzyme
VGEAIERAAAYEAAGADGFFVPGLMDQALIRLIVEATRLPVNVMMLGEPTSISRIADTGVARVSYGPGAYLNAMSDLRQRFGTLTARS